MRGNIILVILLAISLAVAGDFSIESSPSLPNNDNGNSKIFFNFSSLCSIVTPCDIAEYTTPYLFETEYLNSSNDADVVGTCYVNISSVTNTMVFNASTGWHQYYVDYTEASTDTITTFCNNTNPIYNIILNSSYNITIFDPYQVFAQNETEVTPKLFIFEDIPTTFSAFVLNFTGIGNGTNISTSSCTLTT